MSNIEHPQYTAHKERWKDVRDLLCNQYQDYVIPPSTKQGKRVTDRNNAYVKRARFTNFTLNTKNGLLGIATQEPAKEELATGIEYIKDSATGNGLTLEQAYQWVLGEVLATGRAILYTDMPAVPLGMSGEETRIINPQARMYLYKAEDMPIWETDYINGQEVLIMAALREERSVREANTFKYKTVVQYRILELDELGRFYYYIVDKLDGGNILQDPVYPQKQGEFLTEIPLTVVGAENNNVEPDNSILWPIAHLNIGHLRNSASLEYNIETHGRITFGITSDLSKSDWKQLNQSTTIKPGSDSGLFLGKSGGLHHFQPLPNQLASEEMKHKVEQMVMLGAHIITNNSANAPVETTRLNMGAKTSPLQVAVNNCAAGINEQLDYISEYMGVEPGSSIYEVNTNFIPRQADPALMQQLAAWWMQGMIPQSVPIQYGREVGLIPDDIEDEELIEEIDTEAPLLPVDNDADFTEDDVNDDNV